jgi:hypothetical protein
LPCFSAEDEEAPLASLQEVYDRMAAAEKVAEVFF